jgi:hypothetical protein
MTSARSYLYSSMLHVGLFHSAMIFGHPAFFLPAYVKLRIIILDSNTCLGLCTCITPRMPTSPAKGTEKAEPRSKTGGERPG